MCNAAYGSTGWLGIASISVTGGVHITSAYVKINDSYFTQAQYNTVPYKHLVMCQEVGHTFGLDHQDTNQTNPNLGTCMDYTRNPAGPPSNEHPNSHDYAQLQTIHSHLDSTNTTLAPSGPSLAGTDSADNAGAWGARVSGADRQGAATYQRDLSNGQKVITFVLWA
ncbi:hypothetical protein ACPPVO_44005 [Dactylosporangium sp. McL0621]|uniref:hypothetical protein n=1 Tax=Dactylosporangium sp. McL0621 TaxID=3415678 RepID=UPI003CEB8854